MHRAPATAAGRYGRAVFVLLLTYVKPLPEVDALMREHMAWLKKSYAAGRFLVSGRQIPRTGGVILARGDDRAEIEALAASDPFVAAASRRARSSSSARRRPRPRSTAWSEALPRQRVGTGASAATGSTGAASRRRRSAASARRGEQAPNVATSTVPPIATEHAVRVAFITAR